MPVPVSAMVIRTYSPCGMTDVCEDAIAMLDVLMVSVPPRGIASREFAARFIIT